MTNIQQHLGHVLVFGGCGFLGHEIVKQLLESNATNAVSVFDVRTDRNRLPTVAYHDGDISSKNDVQAVFNHVKPQVVFHTASPSAATATRDFLTKVNINGTRNIVECALLAANNIAFIYTSSASVIHDSVSNVRDIDDDAPTLFLPVQKEAYAHTKAVAEALVLAANRKNGRLLTTAIRPSGLFGEGDLTTVKPVVEAAASGRYKYQVGNGDNLFDWTYVGNAAQAHILAAQVLCKAFSADQTTPITDAVDGEAFLVTNDEPIPFWDFCRALGTAAGYPTKKEEIKVIPRIVGLAMATIAEWLVWMTSFGRKRSSMTRNGIKYSTMTRTFRIDKAKKRLKYKPLVSMNEEIKRAGNSIAKQSEKMK